MSIINLIPIKREKSSTRKFSAPWSAKKSMCLTLVIIPLSIMLFYGIEDKNADFFAKAKYPDDYRAVYNNTVYRMGIMVSHSALIVTLSIVGILISWIGHEAFKLLKDSINENKEFKSNAVL